MSLVERLPASSCRKSAIGLWMLAFAAGLVASLTPVAAQSVMLSEPAGSGGHGVEIVAPFGDSIVPADGFMLMLVRLTNNGNAAREWQISVQVEVREHGGFGSGSRQNVGGTNKRLIAPPGQVSTHEILVPIPGHTSRHASCSIRLTARSGGINTQTWRSPRLPELSGISLVSQQVARLNMDNLEDEARKPNPDWRFGSQVATPEMPRDWRALMGWTGLLISEPEWDGLTPEQRQAVRQWVRFGGRLILFTEAEDAGLVLQRVAGRAPLALAERRSRDVVTAGFTLGTIEVRGWKGGSLDAEAVVNRLRGTRRSNVSLVEVPPDHVLEEIVPKLTSGNTLFGLLLIAYCLVMGPVNLYVLAPAKRRHRLFFTTPLIAIGAAVLMLAVGFLRDGIGMKGARTVFVELRPEESAAYQLQGQIYRSGMLGSGSFNERSPTVIQSVSGPEQRSGRQLFLQDGVWSGNLFGSRQRQVHRLNATRSTRERLEWREPADGQTSATVNSTLGWPVDELWIHGPDGRWWRSKGPLGSGGQVEMTSANGDEAVRAINQMMARSPVVSHPMVKELPRETGRFFAFTSKEGNAAAIPTLVSDGWIQTMVVTTGPIMARAAVGSGASAETPDQEVPQP